MKVLSALFLFAIAPQAGAAGILCQEKNWATICPFASVKVSDVDAEVEEFRKAAPDMEMAFQAIVDAMDLRHLEIEHQLQAQLVAAKNEKARWALGDIQAQVTESYQGSRAKAEAYRVLASEDSSILKTLGDLRAFVAKAKAALADIPASNEEARKAALSHYSREYDALVRKWYAARKDVEERVRGIRDFKVEWAFALRFRYFDMNSDDCFMYAGRLRDDEQKILYGADWVRALIHPEKGLLRLKCFDGWPMVDLFRGSQSGFSYDLKSHKGVARYDGDRVSAGTFGSRSATRYTYPRLHEILDAVVAARKK